MKRKTVIFGLFILVLGMLLAACGETGEAETITNGRSEVDNVQSNEGTDENDDDNDEVVFTDEWDEDGDPVVVQVMYPWEGHFQAHVLDIVEDELPKNITLEVIGMPAQSEPLQEMNAAGLVPDVMLAQWGVESIYELDMLEPLDDYIERYGVDLDEFDESVIELYRAMDPSGEGRLIGLSTLVDTAGLFYNEEVFDAFGIAYPDPEVPMTWKEVLDLSARLTGEHNGVNYRGFDVNDAVLDALLPFKQFGVNLTDPETGEVLIRDSAEVRQFIELVQSIYNIPGIYDSETGSSGSFGQRTTAMTISWPAFFRWGLGGDDIDMFDAAPFPVWEEGGKGPLNYSHPYVLNKHGENKDAGFQFILAIARVLNRNPLTNPFSEFSETHENYHIYEDKNMEVFWNYEGAFPPERVSKWDEFVNLETHINELAEGMDINEYLRITSEESVVKIEDAVAAQE